MTTNTKPPTAPLSKVRGVYIIGLIIAAVVFAVTAAAAAGGQSMGWETSLFRYINDWSWSLQGLFTVITFFGSTWMALVVVVAVFAARAYRLAWRLAITIVGAYGAAFLAKHFVGRVRPAEMLAHIHTRAVETGMGFPSGHATLSTVVALTLLPYLPKWIGFIGAPIFIGLVCLSRLYLGVHFPLDIIGGMAIGTGAVCVLRLLPAKLLQAVRLDQK